MPDRIYDRISPDRVIPRSALLAPTFGTVADDDNLVNGGLPYYTAPSIANLAHITASPAAAMNKVQPVRLARNANNVLVATATTDTDESMAAFALYDLDADDTDGVFITDGTIPSVDIGGGAGLTGNDNPVHYHDGELTFDTSAGWECGRAGKLSFIRPVDSFISGKVNLGNYALSAQSDQHTEDLFGKTVSKTATGNSTLNLDHVTTDTTWTHGAKIAFVNSATSGDFIIAIYDTPAGIRLRDTDGDAVANDQYTIPPGHGIILEVVNEGSNQYFKLHTDEKDIAICHFTTTSYARSLNAMAHIQSDFESQKVNLVGRVIAHTDVYKIDDTNGGAAITQLSGATRTALLAKIAASANHIDGFSQAIRTTAPYNATSGSYRMSRAFIKLEAKKQITQIDLRTDQVDDKVLYRITRADSNGDYISTGAELLNGSKASISKNTNLTLKDVTATLTGNNIIEAGDIIYLEIMYVELTGDKILSFFMDVNDEDKFLDISGAFDLGSTWTVHCACPDKLSKLARNIA